MCLSVKLLDKRSTVFLCKDSLLVKIFNVYTSRVGWHITERLWETLTVMYEAVSWMWVRRIFKSLRLEDKATKKWPT